MYYLDESTIEVRRVKSGVDSLHGVGVCRSGVAVTHHGGKLSPQNHRFLHSNPVEEEDKE